MFIRGSIFFFGIGNCIFSKLDVPAIYESESSKPTSRFGLTQEYWNKTSLALRIGFSSTAILVDKLSFLDGQPVCSQRKYYADRRGLIEKLAVPSYILRRKRDVEVAHYIRPIIWSSERPTFEHIRSIFRMAESHGFC
jgi:hypothetical protein